MVAVVEHPFVTCPFEYVSKKKPSPWAAGYHPGIDFRASIGTPTFAPVDSKIISVTPDDDYGNKVIGETVLDGKKYQWILAHHKKGGVLVKKGQTVKAGQKVGLSGSTGNTYGAHVHFEAREYPFKYADHVDPQVLLDADADNIPAPPPATTYTVVKGDTLWGIATRAGVNPADLADWNPQLDDPSRIAPGDVLNLAPGVEVPKPQPTDPEPQMPFEILPRSEWTTTKDNRHDDLDQNKVVAITCHYPADGDRTYATLSKSQVAAKLEAYRKHHVNGNGWKDIGYNYAIDQAGRVWFLTGDDIGAHANTVGNTTSIGVLFVIGNSEQPTERAIEAFKALRALKLLTFRKATKVQGHQQVPGNSTSCPGKPLMAAIKAGRLSEPSLPVDPDEPVDNMDPSGYRSGIEGSHVDWLRGQLNKHGHKVAATGPYDAEVVKAVKAFQREQGWSGSGADGYPGPLTLERIAVSPPPIIVDEPPLEPEQPADPTKPPVVFDIGFANLLMGYRYGRPWTKKREEESAEALLAMRCSIYGICEAHEESNMVGHWYKHIEEQAPQFRLHPGATRPDGNGLIWDEDKYNLLRNPVTINLSKTSIRNATRYNLEHVERQVPFWTTVTHLIAKYKSMRDAQMRELLRVEDYADRHLLIGDFNGYSLKRGPVPIAKANGWLDAREEVDVVNAGIKTHPAGNLDHIFYPDAGLVKVTRMEYIEAGDLSDHNWIKATVEITA